MDKNDKELASFPQLRAVFLRPDVRSLAALSLAGQKLTAIPSRYVFSELPALVSLDLSRNSLRELNGDSLISGAPKLATLNLAHNEIDDFRTLLGLAKLAELRDFDVRENPVTRGVRFETLLPKLLLTERVGRVDLTAAIANAGLCTDTGRTERSGKRGCSRGFPVYAEKPCLPRNFGLFRKLERLNGRVIVYRDIAMFVDFEKLTDIVDAEWLRGGGKRGGRSEEGETRSRRVTAGPPPKNIQGYLRRYVKERKRYEEIYHIKGDREPDILVSLLKIARINNDRKAEERGDFDHVRVLWRAQYKKLAEKLRTIKQRQIDNEMPVAVEERGVAGEVRPGSERGEETEGQPEGEREVDRQTSLARETASFATRKGDCGKGERRKGYLDFSGCHADFEPEELLVRQKPVPSVTALVGRPSSYKGAGFEGETARGDTQKLTLRPNWRLTAKSPEVVLSGGETPAPAATTNRSHSAFRFESRTRQKSSKMVQNTCSGTLPTSQSQAVRSPSKGSKTAIFDASLATLNSMIEELEGIAKTCNFRHVLDAIEEYKAVGQGHGLHSRIRTGPPPQAEPQTIAEQSGYLMRGSALEVTASRTLTNRCQSAMHRAKTGRIQGPFQLKNSNKTLHPPTARAAGQPSQPAAYLSQDRSSLALQKAIFIMKLLHHTQSDIRRAALLAKVNAQVTRAQPAPARPTVDPFMEWDRSELSRNQPVQAQLLPEAERPEGKRVLQAQVHTFAVQLQPPAQLSKREGKLTRSAQRSRTGSAKSTVTTASRTCKWRACGTCGSGRRGSRRRARRTSDTCSPTTTSARWKCKSCARSSSRTRTTRSSASRSSTR